MPTVRTTIRPDKELEVDDAEYADLQAMGLLIAGSEQHQIAEAQARAEADRKAAAASGAGGQAPGGEPAPADSTGGRPAGRSTAKKER